jgi:hypothetical protein
MVKISIPQSAQWFNFMNAHTDEPSLGDAFLGSVAAAVIQTFWAAYAIKIGKL